MAAKAIRITKDEITPALKGLVAGLQGKGPIMGIVNTAKAVIVNRTLAGESLENGTFASYSKKRYYASIAHRAPGVPAPGGGRTTALRGGRKLKSVVYDEGYGQYKSAMGRGASPQLSLTNMMLDAMQTAVINNKKAIIFFGSNLANIKAHGLHTGKFPFFGLRSDESKNLYETLAAQLRKIKGMTGR